VAAQFTSIAPTRTKYLGRHSWKVQCASKTKLVEENSWIKLTGTEKPKLPGSMQNSTENVVCSSYRALL